MLNWLFKARRMRGDARAAQRGPVEPRMMV